MRQLANRRAWWLTQLRILVTITLGVAAGLVLVFGQDWRATLIYCFFITLSCSVLVQSLRWCFTRLLQLRHPGRATSDWPGWPLMLLSLVLGTGLGYSLGNEIGNALTGHNALGLHNTSLRRALVVMAISLVPGVALTLIFLGRSRIAQAEAHAQTQQRLAAETQLRLLESQLEPHMLFNTLANLRVLIGLDAQRAQAMLDHLIAFLRATLAASRADRHGLQQEFARLADYLALMQVRMGSRLRFEFKLPAELAEVPMPPLLLQPLVENAIQHGLEPHVQGGLLQISARQEADLLVLEVADDGRGLSQPSPRTDGGFGTQQVRERLAVAYGPRASLSLQPRPQGGTLARIQLPLHHQT
jgi:hypothetical protein